jgi:hypothetical protein
MHTTTAQHTYSIACTSIIVLIVVRRVACITTIEKIEIERDKRTRGAAEEANEPAKQRCKVNKANGCASNRIMGLII